MIPINLYLLARAMKAYVGITDYKWFDLLRRIPQLEEVNFWQPGGTHVFKAIKPGEFFLFKLHSPRDFIVGGGIFAYSNILPISLAWESFDIKNGATTLLEMHRRVEKYKRQPENPLTNYDIGCILLEQPFFLPEEQWIPVPDWKAPIVQGKTYDLSIEPGRSLWRQLHLNTLMASVQQDEQSFIGVKEGQARYGDPTPVLPRLGQGTFRILVTDTYKRRCAVTREKTLPALEAAHIKPYSNSGKHDIRNGILFRRDIHALFDQGYVTITPEMKFQVSHKIKEEFENGHDYYRMQGSPLWLPDNPSSRPSLEYVKWHNENKYLG
jgi:putative restriction endonuclease